MVSVPFHLRRNFQFKLYEVINSHIKNIARPDLHFINKQSVNEKEDEGKWEKERKT